MLRLIWHGTLEPNVSLSLPLLFYWRMCSYYTVLYWLNPLHHTVIPVTKGYQNEFANMIYTNNITCLDNNSCCD